MGRIFKRHNIKIAHKPTRTVKSELCHLKDKRENKDKSGVVYALDCESCVSIYVGETGRQVKDRMKEHQNDILKKKPASKVYQHTAETGHGFDFEGVRVLDICPDLRVRRQLESVHTHLQSNAINRAITLDSTYHPIVRDMIN